MSKFELCPFCGCADRRVSIRRQGSKGYRVICGRCGASGPYVLIDGIDSKENKIIAQVETENAWNHRAEQGQTAKATETEALLDRYAAAARTIALYLDEFCDTGKPYDEMIACAARSAAEALERVKQELDAAVKCLCASCRKITLSGNTITCCEMCHWHREKEE